MKAQLTEKISIFPWFKELSPSVRDELIKVARIARFQPGQVIGRAGDQLNYLLAVIDGVVQNVQQNQEQKILLASDHGSGSIIGWLTAIDQKPLVGSLIAKTAAEILLIPMATVRAQLLNSQPVVTRLLSQMSALIRKHEEERRILMLPNAFQRIYLHILNLAQSVPAPTQEIRLPNQGEIAVHVNTSRETVSRAIQQLLKQGVITKQGHRIQLQQPEILKRLAETGVEQQHKVRELNHAHS